MLQIFDLDFRDIAIGQIAIGNVACGSINLDFRRHANLKQIKIKQEGCRYYSFYHEFGRYWKNINIPTNQETLTLDQTKRTPYHLNLAWNTNKNIDIQLSDCK